MIHFDLPHSALVLLHFDSCLQLNCHIYSSLAYLIDLAFIRFPVLAMFCACATADVVNGLLLQLLEVSLDTVTMIITAQPSPFLLFVLFEGASSVAIVTEFSKVEATNGIFDRLEARELTFSKPL